MGFCSPLRMTQHSMNNWRPSLGEVTLDTGSLIIVISSSMMSELSDLLGPDESVVEAKVGPITWAGVQPPTELPPLMEWIGPKRGPITFPILCSTTPNCSPVGDRTLRISLAPLGGKRQSRTGRVCGWTFPSGPHRSISNSFKRYKMRTSELSRPIQIGRPLFGFFDPAIGEWDSCPAGETVDEDL